MKIVDLNVLLYAVNASAPEHRRALAWWEGALNGDDLIGLPWIVVLGFLRLSTNARVFPRPLTADAAVEKISGWLACEPVRVVREKDDHWTVLRGLLADAGTAGNLTTDAHLAALALSHDAVLVTSDLDFGRFTGLRRENPLRMSLDESTP